MDQFLEAVLWSTHNTRNTAAHVNHPALLNSRTVFVTTTVCINNRVIDDTPQIKEYKSV